MSLSDESIQRNRGEDTHSYRVHNISTQRAVDVIGREERRDIYSQATATA